ncbi:MAG: site-2 protease family protein [Nanoarchaeota archaeon]
MASFMIYDLIFLVAFAIFVSVFLYTRKHNLKRDGLLFLYRTSWGIKLINYLGNKYRKTLKVLSYVSIATGYLLMVGIFYVIYTIVKVYLFNPSLVRAIKIPPILPLVPYLPQMFKLDFLPPFYFTYWIVILAVIAITHEMAHGIFAVYNKIKVKTTGFGFFPFFLPVFLAAFVELDEKKMAKKSEFKQMAILSAGTFANVLTAILFFGVLWIFFTTAFVPSGVMFDSYATSAIAISGISSVNGINVNLPRVDNSSVSYEDVIKLTNSDGLNRIGVGSKSYLITKEALEKQNGTMGVIGVYDSAPAIKANLSSVILEINGIKVDSIDKLAEELSKYSPGTKVMIKTKTKEGSDLREIILEEHPEKPGTSWLGIGFFGQKKVGVVGSLVQKMSSFREQGVYYEPKFDGISIFVYNLLWWVILISLSVALMNMLPVGIFDGGRFFYLTVLSITKNEKIAKKAFAFSTYFFLFILLLLMLFWAISFIR